jgi:hypothetical protein
VLALAGPAGATSIPDLTIYSANITYDGVDFSSTCTGCFLSWVDSTNTFGISSNADFSLKHKTTAASDFTFSVVNFDPTFAPIGTMLAGTVISFASNVFNPGPGAVFAGTLSLSSTSLGFGNSATVNFSSFDFADGAGTADVDIAAVPEPATLSLLGLGSAIMAARARRARKRNAQPE